MEYAAPLQFRNKKYSDRHMLDILCQPETFQLLMINYQLLCSERFPSRGDAIHPLSEVNGTKKLKMIYEHFLFKP